MANYKQGLHVVKSISNGSSSSSSSWLVVGKDDKSYLIEWVDRFDFIGISRLYSKWESHFANFDDAIFPRFQFFSSSWVAFKITLDISRRILLFPNRFAFRMRFWKFWPLRITANLLQSCTVITISSHILIGVVVFVAHPLTKTTKIVFTAICSWFREVTFDTIKFISTNDDKRSSKVARSQCVDVRLSGYEIFV